MRPFFGRERDIEELLALSDAASAGRARIALLAGEPGIGKTRLAEEFAERLGASGFASAWGRAWEGDGAPPFWLWVQVFRSLPVHDPFQTAGTEGASASGGDAAAARFKLFDHAVGLLADETAGRPAVVILDDLHWADEPSLLFLRFLANDTRALRLLVVGTYRPAETTAGGALAEVIADLNRDALRIELSGLPEDACGRLIEATTGAETSPGMARAVHRRTAGNPFFVRELARLLASQGRMDPARGPQGDLDLGVPEGVREVIERRVARLAQPTETALSAAAVLGQEFEVAVLSEMLAETTLPALDEAASARLVEPVEGVTGRFRFSHALVRDALYTDLPGTVRVDLHRRAAEAIERLAGDSVDEHVAELADHSLRAVPAVDPATAARFAERAGHRALSRMAYEEAVGHFARALETVDQGSDRGDRLRLLLALGDAMVRAGDLLGSRARFEEAAGLARRLDRPEDLARAALGVGAGLTGFEVKVFDRRQIDLLEEALDRVGPEDSSLRSWVLARLSVAVSYAETAERREELSREAVAIAERMEDGLALAYALSSLCDAIAGPDHVHERWEAASRMVELARAAGEPEMELLGRRFRVVALLEQGRVAEVDAEVDAFARLAEPIRQPLYLWYVPIWRAMRALIRGEFANAEVLAARAEEMGSRASSQNAEMLVLTVRMLGAHMKGEAGVPTERTAELMETYAAYPAAAAALALANLDLERPDRAREGLRFVVSSVRTTPRDSEFMASMTYVAEVAWGLGDPEGAEDVYEILLPHRDLFAVDGIGAVLIGSLERPLGILAALIGRPEDADRHFIAAEEAHRRIGAPALLAQAQADHAAALVRAAGSVDRAPERALALASEAARTFDAMGAADMAGRIRRSFDGASMLDVRLPPAAELSADGDAAPGPAAALTREGEVWTVAWAGRSTRLRDTKGLRDLAVLLARPGIGVHVLELAALGNGRDPAAPAGADRHSPGAADEVADATARAAYRERLRDLAADLQDADANHDAGRAAALRAEIDTLTDHLVGVFGLGGRSRTAGDPAERARKAVAARIRDAIRRVGRDLPQLGRHLERSVRTGAFCSYDPPEPVRWVVRP